jgi:flavin reductase (DIM6/NTAB) family NADH-FMN oxidoreductase RutF
MKLMESSRERSVCRLESRPSPVFCHQGSDADAYRRLARRWVGSVTVITTQHAVTEGGSAFDGVTATAFLTISINPPIVLVSIDRKTRAASAVTAAGGFVINLLAQNQEDLSRRFSRPQSERALIPWDRISAQRDARGMPVLNGTIGAYSVDVREVVEAGDHAVVLGDVKQIWLGPEDKPLLYGDRTYARLGAIREVDNNDPSDLSRAKDWDL